MKKALLLSAVSLVTMMGVFEGSAAALNEPPICSRNTQFDFETGITTSRVSCWFFYAQAACEQYAQSEYRADGWNIAPCVFVEDQWAFSGTKTY
jgi:hypothetical protein